MKTNVKQIVLSGCLLTVALSGLAQVQQPGPGQGGKHIDPPDPALMARLAKIERLGQQAWLAMKAQNTERAVELLRQAIDIQRPYGPPYGVAYDLALVLTSAGRNEDALAAYKLAFKWNEKFSDLECGYGFPIQATMDYAILLARMGKAEEAKAIYYFGLRVRNQSNVREIEPLPLLTIFDPDPEGIYMEYTPQRLEAAALMVMTLHGGVLDLATGKVTPAMEILARVKQLAPDWFYPYMWETTQAWKDPKKAAPKLALAEALASDQEQQLIDKYKVELAEHIQSNISNDTPRAEDGRPMTEGNRRRALMKVLKPNPTILKSLAAG